MIRLYFTLFSFFPNQLNDWIVQFIISIIASIIGAFLGYFLAMKAERNKRKQEEITEFFKEKEKAKSIIRFYLLLLKDTQKYIVKHTESYDNFIDKCKRIPCQSNLLTTHANTSLKKLYSFSIKELFDSLYVLNNKNGGTRIEENELNTTSKLIDYIHIAFEEMDSMVYKHRNLIFEREKAVQSNLNTIIQTLRFLKGIETEAKQTEISIFLQSNSVKLNETDFSIIKDRFISPLYTWIQQDNKLDAKSETRDSYFKLYTLTQECINQIDNIRFNTLGLADSLAQYLINVNAQSKPLSVFYDKMDNLIKKPLVT